jgi:hypothetical protein
VWWAVFHPFAACKTKHRLPEAVKIYEEVKLSGKLDGNESGGKLDAFRHVFSMAYLSQSIKIRKLRKLGIAHEKGNRRQFYKNRLEYGERPDSLSCVMDLRNNEVGFELGSHHKKLEKEELKKLVIDHILAGQAWYLKRNDKNEYVSCENEPVKPEKYCEKWFMPKCLVKTNE